MTSPLSEPLALKWANASRDDLIAEIVRLNEGWSKTLEEKLALRTDFILVRNTRPNGRL